MVQKSRPAPQRILSPSHAMQQKSQLNGKMRQNGLLIKVLETKQILFKWVINSTLTVKNIRQGAKALLRNSIFLYQYNAKIDKISSLEEYENHFNLISRISINILCMDVLSFCIKKTPSAVMVIF